MYGYCEEAKATKLPCPGTFKISVCRIQKTTSILSDPIIEEDKIEQQRGALDYNYSAQPKYITPLKNVISQDQYFKFLTEFNINPIPSSFSFRNELNRFQSTTEYRFMEPEFSDCYTKRFTWDSNYNLAWNLTRTLRIKFTAIDNADIES